jgi:two-component system alkaline phosphatase synthesis response regulator PhoP
VARILVVEDDAAIRGGLVDLLKLEGHEVAAARDGEAGLTLGLKEAPDLVVLDLMLPKRNGFDLLRALRADAVPSAVLVLSARDRESDKVLALELGADDYVTKPFSVRELAARVHALLRRREAPGAPAAFAFGDVAIDFERYRATRRGKPLALTAREFALLRHFVRRRGKLVTRDELLRDVWGHEEPPATRTVDTHVAQLRKKIEPRPARPRYLISVRGAGYRFDA